MAKAKRKTSGELDADTVTSIRADIENWYAGRWAEEFNVGPACHCGLRSTKEACPRHDDRTGGTG